MTNNPIERLRNLLSPFLNLANIMALDHVDIETSRTLKILIESNIKVCAENQKLIHHYLDMADDIISKTEITHDYKKLAENLDEFLATQTREDLEKWLNDHKNDNPDIKKD